MSLLPISRADASALGLPRYFTGEPCRHGHVCERYVAEPGSCVECQKKKNRRDRWLRAQWANGPSPAARARNRYKAQKVSARDGDYARAPHEKDCPPRPRDGRCQTCRQIAPALAGKGPGRDSLVMDHDHQTGVFRGWLCVRCNVRAGP